MLARCLPTYVYDTFATQELQFLLFEGSIGNYTQHQQEYYCLKVRLTNAN